MMGIKMTEIYDNIKVMTLTNRRGWASPCKMD